jgi:hypothetical protein
MRIREILAAGLLLTLASAGCARGGNNQNPGVATAQTGKPKVSSSPSVPAQDTREAALKFSQCMREHGMTWFPDPQPGGGLTIRTPKGLDSKKMEAAHEACKKYEPNGGVPPKMNAADLEKARQMAQCMREHGVPKFPDPDPNGAIIIKRGELGSGPGDPTFDKAQQQCAKYGPAPHLNGNDKGTDPGTGPGGVQGQPA